MARAGSSEQSVEEAADVAATAAAAAAAAAAGRPAPAGAEVPRADTAAAGGGGSAALGAGAAGDAHHHRRGRTADRTSVPVEPLSPTGLKSFAQRTAHITSDKGESAVTTLSTSVQQ